VIGVRHVDLPLLVRVVLISEGGLVGMEECIIIVAGIVMVTVIRVTSVGVILVLNTPPLSSRCNHLQVSSVSTFDEDLPLQDVVQFAFVVAQMNHAQVTVHIDVR